MKCKCCGSEWTVSQNFAAQIKNCPFCSAPIEEPKNIAEALQLITSIHGPDVLKDGDRLLSCFSETAPKLDREKRLFSFFLDCHGHEQLFAMKQGSENEQDECVNRIVIQMREKFHLAENACRSVCYSYLTALADRKPYEWYRKEAELGEADAQYNLGRCLETGCGVSVNLAEAASWYEKAANQGYVPAQCRFGYFLEEGIGVSKNAGSAYRWYGKAADKGDLWAQWRRACCTENGTGTYKSESQAVEMYRRVAEKGYAPAQYSLGYLLERNADAIIRANNEIYYIFNEYDWDEDFKANEQLREAAEWYRRAAEQGYAPAQYRLGLCLENGTGIGKSRREADEWYRKAAAQGYSDAVQKLSANS